MSEPSLQFWFEFGSTYSYPAALRIERLAEQHGVAVRWRSFLLGPIFRDQGWTDSPFNLQPAKGAYMWRDLERVCRAEQLPFQRPSQFPRNGLLAARIVCRFPEAPWLPEFVRGVYRANFERDLDIGLPATVARCLEESGQEPTFIVNEASTPEGKERLRMQTEQAVSLGIFGSPSFITAGELFWGNDRLEDALVWAKQHAEPA